MSQSIVEITLALPDAVAREADANGLLTSQAYESMLREELSRRRIDRLFDAADRLGQLPVPPLTQGEIEEEILAARRARSTPNADHR